MVPLPYADGDPMSTTDPAAPDRLEESFESGPGAPARRTPWRLLAAGAAVVLLAFLLFVVRLPYFVFSPGPTENVVEHISVDGATTYPTASDLRLTTVYYRQANLFQILDAWLDPAQSVVPRDAVIPPGVTPEQNLRVARAQMDNSQVDATIVALTKYANYPTNHGEGVLVENVFLGTPAEGKLFPGDVVTQVDGTPVNTPDEVGAKIEAAGVGTPLSFTVVAGGKTQAVEITPAKVKDVDRPVIGVSLVQNFPFTVNFTAGNIGGPSAGLMWTLGLGDLLTPGDLSGDRVIAGTGTIAPDGTVGPIGGVEEKVVGAERAGASVFLAPVQDAKAARAVADHITVVPVASYEQALDYLQRSA
jgi:PDZ domain-containing protein